MASPQHTSRVRRPLTRASALVFGLLALCACSNDMEKVRFFGRQDPPVQQLDSATVIQSEGGSLKVVMVAPLIKIYNIPENKTVCPRGVELRFYDGARVLKNFVRADYGVSYDDRNVMELHKNVVIIDYQTGDTSYLSDLHWDGVEHRIYSQHAVRSVNGPRVTIGDAFVSDEDFNTPLIVHQRGTILVEESEE